MAAMMIQKRDGMLEPIDISRIRVALAFASAGVDGVDPVELELDAALEFYEGMPVGEIQQTLIRVAAGKITETAPGWDQVAERLLLYDVYNQARVTRGLADIGYGDYPGLVRRLVTAGRYDAALLEAYSPEDLERAGAALVPERDYLFSYPGLQHLVDRYLVRDNDGRICELPQEAFMGIALELALAEQSESRMQWALKFYGVLSRLDLTMATPTFANARKPNAQLSSCFIDTVPDSLDGIYNSLKAFAQVSKRGGGMGVYLGKIRASKSSIGGVPGVAKGVTPWARLFNDTAIAVDQLGQRAGAVSLWLDIWHKDILAFLELKTNQGDIRAKAPDIYPGVCIPDAFYRAVEEDASWSLFDPYEVEAVMGFRLEDAWGEEWEARYRACVEEPRLSRDTVPALDLMAQIMRTAVETGTPFLFHRDSVNRLNPNAHAGMIYCSNLCTEIAQNMSPSVESETAAFADGTIHTVVSGGDFVVCNLASLHLGHIQTPEQLEEIVPVAVRMLDNVITINHLPLPQASATNSAYRAIGLGVHGYHQYLVNHGIEWESEAHLEAADALFETIAYHAIAASNQLARERGSYPRFAGSAWSTGEYFSARGYESSRWRELKEQVAREGMRNGYLLAIAPTGSTSILANATASVDPIFQRIFTEEKKGLVVRRIAPGLTPETASRFKEAHYINQQWSLLAAGRRQRHLDQSQSLNLYATPDLDARRLLEWYLLAWKSGVKTVYYFRDYEFDDMAPAEWPEIVCESCEI